MNAWLKRETNSDEVISVIPNTLCRDAALVYDLYKAYDKEYLGRILFDDQRYWIYDGEQLTVTEQEQLGKFIQHNMEVL